MLDWSTDVALLEGPPAVAEGPADSPAGAALLVRVVFFTPLGPIEDAEEGQVGGEAAAP